MTNMPNGDTGSGNSSGKKTNEELAGEGQQEWLDFPNLVGTHLSWRRRGIRTVELVAADGSVWAAIDNRGADLFRNTEIHADGRIFEVRQRKELKARIKDVVDMQTGETVMGITGRHYNRRGDTKAALSDQGSLEFPVRGSGPRKAVMYAIDEKGCVLIRYRLKKPTVGDWLAGRVMSVTRVEVVVSPIAMAMPIRSVLVAASSKLLVSYFQHPSGG